MITFMIIPVLLLMGAVVCGVMAMTIAARDAIPPRARSLLRARSANAWTAEELRRGRL